MKKYLAINVLDGTQLEATLEHGIYISNNTSLDVDRWEFFTEEDLDNLLIFCPECGGNGDTGAPSELQCTRCDGYGKIPLFTLKNHEQLILDN